MFKRLRQGIKARLDFQMTLSLRTPLIYGRETARAAKALRYDETALPVIEDAIPFEPRETYPSRILEWAADRVCPQD